MTEELRDEYDVVVVGGGAAGLNGALMLARARRAVLVVDAGEPRNAPAEGVHGLLGHDGVPPAKLMATGREEVRRYGGHVVHERVVTAAGDGDGFRVTLADGRSVRSRRLLVTTGLTDEVRGRAIAVVGSGPMSVHQALLFRQWSADVTYVSHTMPPDSEQAEQLAARGVRVIDGAVARLDVDGDEPAVLVLTDGTLVEATAVVVAPRMVARAGFLADLGLEPVPHPAGVGEHLPADPTGRTDVPGVWVAGNVTDVTAQVGGAAAAGALAGAHINADLVDEETREAVAAYRALRAVPAGGADA